MLHTDIVNLSNAVWFSLAGTGGISLCAITLGARSSCLWSCLMAETFWSPTIHCHNPACSEPTIRLPYPNPPEISANPPSWPTGTFRVVFVCPICGRGYEYLAPDVHWRQFPTPGPSQPQSPTICVYCEYKCAHENCAIKARHYTLVDSGTDDFAVLSRCLKARSYPLCGAGEFATDYCAETFLRVRKQWQIGPILDEAI